MMTASTNPAMNIAIRWIIPKPLFTMISGSKNEEDATEFVILNPLHFHGFIMLACKHINEEEIHINYY